MRLLISLVIIFFRFTDVYAGTNGILEGRVINKETREPLIGVTVMIAGTAQGTASDTDGNFQLNNLEAGIYDLRISNVGFQPMMYKSVVVRVGLRTRISVELVPSEIELSEVEVTAERPLIEKDVTSTNFSIGSSQVEKLPIRSVQDIITLFPSVTAEGNVRGGKTTEVVYLVDGLPLQDVIGGGMGSSIPKTSITEFSIQSGGFEAEYGNALSGVINIITRRGSNRHSFIIRMEKDNWLAGGWNYQHNKTTDIEGTLAGPVFKDKLHFFTANTFQVTDTRWWQDFDNFFKSPVSTDLSGMVKLDYVMSSKHHLTVQDIYSIRRWRDYEFSWRFNLDGLPPRDRSSNRSTLTFGHTINKQLHYSINLSHYYLTSQIGKNKNDIDTTAYEYDFFLEYIVKGNRAWWSDSRQNIYTGKVDVVYQPNANNVLKAGFEINQYDIFSDVIKYEPQKTYFGKVIPDDVLLNYSSMYHYYPRTGGAFIQEKLEVDKDGAVVNLGFRWDFLDPQSQRPVVEYVNPDTGSNQYQSQVKKYTKASLKQQLSPRMGLSFPLMWDMLLVMNYGHYFQFPLFDYLYSGINPQQLRSGVGVLVGNPDLKPERTHAWELGIKYGIDPMTLLSVTYFKKEFIDQIDSKTFLPSKARAAGDFGFAEYVNNAFATADGIEFFLSRRPGERFSGSISYSLMRTEGVSDYVNQGINLHQWGFPILNEPYPLSWDQLHAIKLVIDANLPYNIVCNILWSYSSGKPYTYFPTKDGYTAEDTSRSFRPNNARLPANNNFNMKFSKRFSFGTPMSFQLYGDIRNLFNSKNPKWADSNGKIGGQLGDPSAYYEPRRFSIGIRYEM